MNSLPLCLLIIIYGSIIMNLQKLTDIVTTLPLPTVRNVGDENSKGKKLSNVVQVNNVIIIK